MTRTADVLVIGGGVIGLSTANEMARHGLQVTVCDSGPMGRRASWAGAGIIPRPAASDTASAFERLQTLSADLFAALSRQLLEQTGIDNGYRACGGLDFDIDGPADEWGEHGVRCDPEQLAILEPNAAADRGPAHHLPSLAQVRNPRHLQALQVAARNLSVTLCPGERVLDFRTAGSKVIEARLKSGVIEAAQYLICAGAWSSTLLRTLGFELDIVPVRGQMLLLRLPEPPLRHVLVQGKRYIVPRDDGRVLVGSTEEFVGYDESTCKDALEDLRQFAITLSPMLANAELEQSWAGLRPGTPDQTPVLGAVPGIQNAWVAAGHFRSGISCSTGTALLMSQLLRAEETVMPVEAFRPDRMPKSAPLAAFRGSAAFATIAPMDVPALRLQTAQLADDLGWLEEHCRSQPDLSEKAGELRLAAALVRNVLSPYLDSHASSPLHVVVVGGAGAGKSTVVNFLTGSRSAEANPQAGFTRHPVAYTHVAGPVSWPSQAGFLGPLQRLDAPSPSSVDEHVYQLRKLPVAADDSTMLSEFVVWDCPDMTTWASTGYVPRLLEVAGLADVVVYVASDERYNDVVPTQFLRLLLEVGKPVVVCLTKMQPENAAAIVKHFETEVLKELPRGRVTTLAIPHLNAEALTDPVSRAAEHRIPLVNQVLVLGDPATEARRRTVQSALRFLTTATQRLLSVARDDVAALDAWKALVRNGQKDFDDRYRREYLTSEKFRRFDDALIRLMELLELPGAGKFVAGTLWVVRTPYRLLKGAMSKVWSKPAETSLPELDILDSALAGWLDQLRAESLRRSGQQALWNHLSNGFERGLADDARARFRGGLQSFQAGLQDEVERTARAIYEELEKSPGRLATLRTSKCALDLLAVGSSVMMGGIGLHDLVIVPIAASISHQLVEWMGSAYVDWQREETRTRQQALVTKFVSGPLAEWLANWPATGGTSYERLQQILSRIPESVKSLDAAVAAASRGAPA